MSRPPARQSSEQARQAELPRSGGGRPVRGHERPAGGLLHLPDAGKAAVQRRAAAQLPSPCTWRTPPVNCDRKQVTGARAALARGVGTVFGGATFGAWLFSTQAPGFPGRVPSAQAFFLVFFSLECRALWRVTHTRHIA